MISVPKEFVEKLKTLVTGTNKRKCKLYIDNNLSFLFFCDSKNENIQHKAVGLKNHSKNQLLKN